LTTLLENKKTWKKNKKTLKNVKKRDQNINVKNVFYIYDFSAAILTLITAVYF